MKSQSSRVALLLALALASPVLTFAGSQSKLHRAPSKTEMLDRTGVTRAVQLGKGSGMTRYQASLSANAYRMQTPENISMLRESAAGSSCDDTAFRK